MNVVLGLSGGSDSLAAAIILKNQNYNLSSLTFLLSDTQKPQLSLISKITQKLEISHYILDLRKKFEKKIIEYFLSSYKTAKTPNPCAICNKEIKFGEGFKYAIEVLKAEKFATGHFADVDYYKGYPLIKRGKDLKKDQSYFLALINKEVIPFLIFPLAQMTKHQAYQIAKKFADTELKIELKKSSQDICFLKGKTLKEFFSEFPELFPEKKGEIIYKNKVVGYHSGFYWFTIGQRKGLGVRLGKPVYVIKIEPETNRIYLGDKKDLLADGLILEEANFHLPLNLWESPFAQIRYRTKLVKVKEIKLLGEKEYLIKFSESVESITPGQVCAFYEKDFLLGGGIIKEAIRPSQL